MTENHESEQSDVLRPNELAEAKSYGKIGLYCMLADKALDVAFLSFAAFVLAIPLDAWLKNFAVLERFASLRLIVLFVIVTALHLAISFPLSFYSGHVVETKFALSAQTFGGWLRRYVKRQTLGAVIGALMILGLYWLIWTVGPYWQLAAAAAFFVVSIVFGQLAPVLILPLFYKIEKIDGDDLKNRVGKLAEGTGLSIEGVYRLKMSDETVKANAMLAGLGSTRRVLLGDTLLDKFSPEEIDVIFAHEIGHHVFKHIRKMIASGVVYTLAGFWVCDLAIRAWTVGRGGVETLDYAQLPVFTLPFVMLVLSLFGLVLEPLQNAISRHFERQADRYALQRTNDKSAYCTAFRKLAKLNKDDPDPPRLEVALFHSHPSIGERLAMAEKYTC